MEKTDKIVKKGDVLPKDTQLKTPLNKEILIAVTSIIVTTIVVGAISYLIFGKSKEKVSNNSVAPINEGQVSKNEKPDIETDFIKGSYRVITVLKNPFAPYFLTVATERSENIDNTSCGSVYFTQYCYFFIEPQADARAYPLTRFIGKWREGQDGSFQDGLILDSIIFKDENTVQFDTKGGDGGFSYEATWNLDLTTGEFTEISSKKILPDNHGKSLFE